jgi:MFS family permease
VIRSLRRYLGLFGEPAFRRLWLAQSISQIGTQVTLLALPLVAILVLGATPFEVAALGAVEFLPFLLFTLPAGAWVDRLPRRRILVVADLGRAAILALIPAASALGILAMWQLYVAAFAAGVLTVFFEIAYQAILSELVDRDRLAEGNSRLETSRSAAQVLGPGLGGFLVGLLTAPVAILVDALSYLGSAAFLIGMLPKRASAAAAASIGAQAEAAPPATRQSLRREIAEGLRFYVRSPLLLAESAAIVTVNLGATIGGSILLVFLVRDLALSPQAIGLAFSVGAAGLLVGAAGGAAFGRRVGIGPALMIGCLLGPAAALLVAVAQPSTAFALLVASAIVQGLTFMVVNINGVSLRQALTPDDLQGRVNATGRWINWSVLPVASIIGGLIATAIGLRPTIVIGALIGMLGVVFIALSPLRSVREMPGIDERAAALARAVSSRVP